MLSINNNKIVNAAEFLYPSEHDDEMCYCHDTISHLKTHERKFYINPNGSTMIYENGNYKYTNCAFSIVRQKLIDWMISVQDYHASSEETLELCIRIFDYIYFKDLFLDWFGDSNLFGLDEDDDDDKYMYVFEPEVKKDKCNVLNQNCNHPNHYAMQYYEPSSHRYSKNCVCGSYHDGHLRIEDLQLIILTAYLLACKYFERFPPKLTKLLQLTENAYTVEQLLQKERVVLEMLQFDLRVPLVTQFIDFYIQHESDFIKNKITVVCYFLTNLTYTDPHFINCLASTLAAAIVTLSKMLICSYTAIDPKQIDGIYNEKLFDTECFYEILNNLWLVFYHSLYDEEAFKTQKRKFSDKKFCGMLRHMEKIEVEILTQHFFELAKRVTKLKNSKNN